MNTLLRAVNRFSVSGDRLGSASRTHTGRLGSAARTPTGIHKEDNSQNRTHVIMNRFVSGDRLGSATEHTLVSTTKITLKTKHPCFTLKVIFIVDALNTLTSRRSAGLGCYNRR
jgi:hypothetical protein